MAASLSSFLIQQVNREPQRTYLSGHSARLSYGEVLCRVRGLTQLFARSERVATTGLVGISTESAEYVAHAVWGAIFAGISLVFLPSCRDPDMMRRVMRETSVDVLLSDEPVLLRKSWCLDLKHVLRWDASSSTAPANSIALLANESREKDAAFIFQTSGTAGEPKWVRVEYRKFAAVIECMQQQGALDHARGQSVFITPPLYHSYGLSSFLEYTSVGATIVLPQGRSPLGPVGDLRDRALRGEVTAIEGVPYFYAQLAKFAQRFNMPALSHLGLGGGGMNHIAFETLRNLYPAITVSVRYGMTETPSVVSHKVFRPPFAGDWISSGKVLPIYSVEIVDDRGQVLGRNQEGEIIIGGACIGSYLGNNGNRLASGDMGYISSTNELVINGRKSLYLKNRGFRVSPEQVESVILSMNGVRDCRVLMNDSKLVAQVVSDKSVSQRDVLKHMTMRLPSYAIADEVVRVKAVPRTASGKVKRHP